MNKYISKNLKEEGHNMSIDLGNLSEGMGMMFMREFMETANRISCRKGQFLFRKGDAPHHLFTLIQGEIRITIGDNDQHVYTVCHSGDIFGWSSLVGGSTYSATAVCTRPSDVLKFDRDALMTLLVQHPDSGVLFFKHLAEMLGKRLLESYRILQGEET